MQEVNILKYHQWLDEGKSFEVIRRDLLIRGFSDEQVTTIISALNEWWLQKKIAQSQNDIYSQKKNAGIILLAVSSFITVYSLWLTAFSVVVIAMGGVAGGLAMIMDGKKKSRTQFFQKKFQYKNRRN